MTGRIIRDGESRTSKKTIRTIRDGKYRDVQKDHKDY